VPLFGKSKKERDRPGPPSLGSGRRLSSSGDQQEVLAALEDVIRSYRAPQYPDMPAYFDAGWTWPNEEMPAPDRAVSCTDSNDDFLLVTLRTAGTGTELGVFPLGAGDDRLQRPIFGHWKQRDPSLTSTGTWPAHLVVLAPPPVPEDYVAELIGRRGFPASPFNVALGWTHVCQHFALKASQGVEVATKSHAAAMRFIDEHGSDRPDRSLAQRILADLALVDYGILPYIQDIPMRIRALLLHSEEGELWKELKR